MVRNNPVTLEDGLGLMSDQEEYSTFDEEFNLEQDWFASPRPPRRRTTHQEPPPLSEAHSSSHLSSSSHPVKFFRVDFSANDAVQQYGFKGNNTPRIVKLYGNDTVFAAQHLEGIDNFKAEIKAVENFFGEARKYYFEDRIVYGHVVEVPRSLHLYEISLPANHPHHVLSDYFKEDDSAERALNATYGEEFVNNLKTEGFYQHKLDIFREEVKRYSANYNSTEEVQIKGPIDPKFIKHIPPAEEVFKRHERTTSRLAA
jgi:hypothetical protein